MANRRMFSLKVVDTDAFLDMPQSSQLLYYSLAMRADDDGFVSNPKKVMRMIGSQDDDYRVLVSKKFIIPFDSGICVIKHWLIHNLIRPDRYSETQWIREKALLEIEKGTKKYGVKNDIGMTFCIPDGTPGKDRLGKDRLNTSCSAHKDFVKWWDEMVFKIRMDKAVWEKADFKNLQTALKITTVDRLQQLSLYFLSDAKFRAYRPSMKVFLSHGVMEGLKKAEGTEGFCNKVDLLAGRFIGAGFNVSPIEIRESIINLAAKFAMK